MSPTLDLSPNGFFETMTGTGSFIPFGNVMTPNMVGSAGAFNPYAPRAFNLQAALTNPYQFNPQFINLAPTLQTQQSQTQQPQDAIAPDEAIMGIPYSGGTGTFLDKLYDLSAWTNDTLKKFGIILFALVLLVLGLYFLAKSTDEGKIAIGAAKTALA